MEGMCFLSSVALINTHQKQFEEGKTDFHFQVAVHNEEKAGQGLEQKSQTNTAS